MQWPNVLTSLLELDNSNFVFMNYSFIDDPKLRML